MRDDWEFKTRQLFRFNLVLFKYTGVHVLCVLGSVHASMLTSMLVSLRYLIVEVLTILGYAKGIRDVGQQATLHIYLLVQS